MKAKGLLEKIKLEFNAWEDDPGGIPPMKSFQDVLMGRKRSAFAFICDGGSPGCATSCSATCDAGGFD